MEKGERRERERERVKFLVQENKLSKYIYIYVRKVIEDVNTSDHVINGECVSESFSFRFSL